jgi:hypothetical protein
LERVLDRSERTARSRQTLDPAKYSGRGNDKVEMPSGPNCLVPDDAPSGRRPPEEIRRRLEVDVADAVRPHN